MAQPALTTAAARSLLPGQAELQAFAHTAAQLLVQPQPRASGARAVARKAGVGLQHLDHRDYAPGDEVRHIDWRQTARRSKPVLRRFEAESSTHWTLLLDASSSMAAHGGTKWRAAVHLAAALSYALLSVGHRVGLQAFGTRVLAECPGGRGPHHYARIARLLAALQPPPRGEASEPGVCAQHLHGSASVVVISDFLAADDMRRDLATLLQRCSTLHALQLDDEADTTLPDSGEFDLLDVETGALLHAVAGPPAHAQAAAERAAMTARLRSFCTRSGVAFSGGPVAQPWQRRLLHHLVQAQRLC